MREHLYRGKRKDNGEWVYGDLLTPTDIMDIWEISENTGMGNRYEVIPETVGEWTGLTDKNGKKIFEGHILKRTYNNGKYVERCVVRSVLSETGYCFCFDGFNYDLDIDTERCKIIGNIHDNPELLEE